MKVTRLEKVSDHRWKVEADGEYLGIFDAEILVKFHVKEGMELDEETFAAAQRAAEYRRARERALYLLDRREYSRWELMQKLVRNVSPEIAGEALDRLEELGLLNDRSYAEHLARHYMIGKNQGARRAVLEIRKRGIDAALAQQAVEQIEPEEDALTTLARRKYSRALENDEDGKGRAKAIRGLMRLGHDYYDAAEAVDAVLAELETNEE